MSWDFWTKTTPVARKNYPCHGLEHVENAIDEIDFTDAELDRISNAKEGIIIGMKYIKVEGKWDGAWTTFRSREDMDQICNEYRLYP